MTDFRVVRQRIDLLLLLRVRAAVIGPKRQFLRRNHTSEVGGEADMPRQLDQRV